MKELMKAILEKNNKEITIELIFIEDNNNSVLFKYKDSYFELKKVSEEYVEEYIRNVLERY